MQPDAKEAEKAATLPGSSITKPVPVLESTKTAKARTSANTSLEITTYPCASWAKILPPCLASNTV